MAGVRVLVANKPRFVRELVLATISDQSDIEIVGQTQNESELEEAIERTRPDFVILALEDSGQLPQRYELLLEQYPHMRILAISPSRNASVVYSARLDIRCQSVESSEEGVLSALRGKLEFGASTCSG